MIYVFHGTDTKTSREKVRALVNSLIAKKPDAAYMRITEAEWTPSTLAETTESQGLFSDRTIVLFDGLLDTDAADEIVESLEDIATSQNIFIILEAGGIDVKTLTKLEKHAEKVQEYTVKERPKEERNLFGLADAFGRRDKKNFWVEFLRAKRGGAVAEEIHGIIFWQLKSILIAAKTDPASSGLKPFVYNKSKQFSKSFTEKELATFSTSLVSMYHDAHRGLLDFNSALEQFVLEL